MSSEEQLRALNMLIEMQQNPENLTDESLSIIDDAVEDIEKGVELSDDAIETIDDIYAMEWEG